MERKPSTLPCPLYPMTIMVVVVVFVFSCGPHVVVADFQCVRMACDSGAPTFQNALRLQLGTVESALRQCFPSFEFPPGVSDDQIAGAMNHLRKCNRNAASAVSQLVRDFHTDLQTGWRSCCITQTLGKRRRRRQSQVIAHTGEAVSAEKRDTGVADTLKNIDRQERRKRSFLQRLTDLVASHTRQRLEK